MDIDEMRRMVPEEPGKTLLGRQMVSAAAAPPVEGDPVDVEAEYGAKLDRMLGSFTSWLRI